MQYSTNYHFKLPAPSDFVNVNDLSENFGSIDTLLKNIADGRTKIAAGSYVGTGTYGVNNQNSLSFSFAPKLILIYKADETSQMWGLWSDGASRLIILRQSSTTSDRNNASLVDNVFSWYCPATGSGTSTAAQYQLNVSGSTYNYVAIG